MGVPEDMEMADTAPGFAAVGGGVMRAVTRLVMNPAWLSTFVADTKPGEQWRRLVKVCKAYQKAGLNYTTEVDTRFDTPMLVVKAWGESKLPNRKPKGHRPRKLNTGTPLTLKQISKRLTEAKQSRGMVKQGFARHVRSGLQARYWVHEPDVEYRKRQHAIGHKLSRAIAASKSSTKFGVPGDYTVIDSIMGERVPRWSQMRSHEKDKGYWGALIWHYANGRLEKRTKIPSHEKCSAPDYAAEYAEAKDDVAFWQECERLAEERDRWKPGLRAEDLSDDQELREVA